MLAPRNAIATGMPTSISATIKPSSSVTAQYHAIGLTADVAAVHEPGAVRAFAAHQEPEEFDRHHAEGKRHEGDQHPARHVERAHILFVAEVVVNGDCTAVPREHQRDGNARDDDHFDQRTLEALGERGDQELDIDVTLLAHQPRRTEQRDEKQEVFSESEEMRRALVAEI